VKEVVTAALLAQAQPDEAGLASGRTAKLSFLCLTKVELATALTDAGLPGLLDVLWEGSHDLRSAARARAEAEAASVHHNSLQDSCPKSLSQS